MLQRCLLLLTCLSAALPLLAAEAVPIQTVLDRLAKTVDFGETRISPDGQHIAWTEHVRNPDGSESRKTAIYVTAAGTNHAAVRVTAGDGKQMYSENGLAWSPDSKTLLFLSDKERARQPQLYSIAIVNNGAVAKKLTSLEGDIDQPQFSRDGRQIGFLYLENARAVGPRDAYTPETGVLQSAIHEQRIAVLDLPTGAMKTVTPANMFVYEFDWSPDSKSLAYTAAEGDGDNNWWIARLYRIAAAGGAQQEVCKPDAQIAEPHWSPDGKHIAFISGIMSDQGVTGGDVFLADAEGGAARNVTPGLKASANWLRWEPKSKSKLLMGELVDGSFAISELDAEKRTSERLWVGDDALHSTDVADDGRSSAAIRSSWSQAPEIVAGKIGDWRKVTGRNASVKPEWGKTEKLHWANGGYQVMGWLLYPADFDASKRYPMVVSIHGGPASQQSQSWPETGLSLLASQGMFVFFPNPRGSYGEGEAFTKANVKDFGHGDLSDIMAGVDVVVKSKPVDTNRLGVGGWSYGGFMTMWTVTQTQRFKAAVAGAGIANWQSYYGQNLIDQWMIPYFGASVYDDPAVYAKSSPINFVKQVKTPTLIVVGDRDAECPMPQSREFWHALRSEGVKTQLVVYPNEGHHFRDPEHVKDLAVRTVGWFNEYLR